MAKANAAREKIQPIPEQRPAKPVTAQGRVVAVMLMVYGVFVFGYFVSQAVVFLQPGLAQRESGRASNASSARTRRQ